MIEAKIMLYIMQMKIEKSISKLHALRTEMVDALVF